MLLTIDAGNTQTVVGLFRDSQLVDHWRIATVADRTSDELALMVQQFLGFHGFSFENAITGVAISSGVPRVTAELRQMTERYFGFPALILEPGVRSGMPILYDNPKEVGPDRIANAVGAYDLYGGPSIVVDFGTANTVDAVSEKGEYLGGAIFPGIEISLDALFARAAALRRVELVPPKNVLGKSTIAAIQSGAVACVDPVIGNETGNVLEERQKALVDTASRLSWIRDAFVATYCSPHAQLLALVRAR